MTRARVVSRGRLPPTRLNPRRGRVPGVLAVACWLCALLLSAAWAGEPVLRDPMIPDGEVSCYNVLLRSGMTETSTHRVTVVNADQGAAYEIVTDSKTMLLLRQDLTPIQITRRNDDGTVDWRLLYRGDRVNFVFPGPRRNRVEKVDRNRYDVNAITHVVRGFPFGEREQVKFQLVTMDRTVGVGLKLVGEETVRVPAGEFACYKLRAGLTGIKGRLYTRKIYFWVEKDAPHRMVKQEDEGVTDVARTELISWRVEHGGGDQ